MSTRNINIFGFNSFVISSIFIVFIIGFPSLAFLRPILLPLHIIFFYLLILYRYKKVYTNVSIIILLLLILYIIVQSLVLQDDNLVIAQALTVTSLLFFCSQIALSERKSFYYQNKFKGLSKILLFTLPFFLISFTDWSATRQPGLFNNPNITGHLSVILLPFALLGLPGKRLKYISIFIVLLIVLSTASRSSLMALLLGLTTYLLVYKFQKLSFLALTSIIAIVVLISMYAVEIAVSIFNKFSSLLSGVDSRLLYLSYNGRDKIFDYALSRFETQPWFGLGFGGTKFDLDGHILGTHNGYIELLLKFGILGTTLFFLYSISLLWMTSKHNTKYKASTMMSLAAISSLSTNSSTFFVLNYLFIYCVMLVSIGYKVSSTSK